MMLFDAPLIPGLSYRETLIDASEEAELLRHIERVELAPFKFQGWEGRRLTRTFGWRYDFDDRSFAPADPLPSWLAPLQAKAAQFAKVDPKEFVHALVTRYDPGAGTGWHPSSGPHTSVVHALPSSHIRSRPLHRPAVHTASTRHAFPGSHCVPSGSSLSTHFSVSRSNVEL